MKLFVIMYVLEWEIGNPRVVGNDLDWVNQFNVDIRSYHGLHVSRPLLWLEIAVAASTPF